MPSDNPNRYLRPWCVADEEELRLLRKIRELVDELAQKAVVDTVLYTREGAELRLGEIGRIVRDLKAIGK